LNGLVEIAYPRSRACDTEGLLKALAAEVGLREVATPEQIPAI
jgi:hypothetical protein